MTPATLAILCFASGVILLIAEVLLPTHGVLGGIAMVGLLIGVGACFWIDQYAGLAAAIILVAAMPFAAALWVKVWPRTPAGKRLILGPPDSARAEDSTVRIGQVGVVVSELRPGGVCDFAGDRIESRCERGTIPAGQKVEVVAVVDHRPLVRAV